MGLDVSSKGFDALIIGSAALIIGSAASASAVSLSTISGFSFLARDFLYSITNGDCCGVKSDLYFVLSNTNFLYISSIFGSLLLILLISFQGTLL